MVIQNSSGMKLLNHNKKITLLCLALLCLGVYLAVFKMDVDNVTKRHDSKLTAPVTCEVGTNGNSLKKEIVTVIIPLEKIKEQSRIKAVGHLLGKQTSADDPRLVKGIREHFIDPPSKLQPKMSRPLVQTAQAKAVDDYLKQKVSDFFSFIILPFAQWES